MTLLYDLLKSDVCGKIKLKLIESWDKVFSLDLLKNDRTIVDDDEILDLIEKRDELKKQKKYEEADKIRDDLLDRGIKLIDGREKTTYELIK